MRRTPWVIGVFLVGLLAGWSMASNTEPADAASSGQKVCVDKRTGAMRLASVRRCSAAERSVTFGAAGEQGPPGPQGVQGAAATGTPRTLTLNYTGSSTSLACGDGASSSSTYGNIYNAPFGSYSTSNLTSWLNWSFLSLKNCTVTITYLAP